MGKSGTDSLALRPILPRNGGSGYGRTVPSGAPFGLSALIGTLRLRFGLSRTGSRRKPIVPMQSTELGPGAFYDLSIFDG